MRDTQQPPGTQAGRDPVEGRDDLDLPGADRAGPPSEHPEAPLGVAQQIRDIGDQPDSRENRSVDELGDRVSVGMPTPATSATPDVLPDVEVPEEQP